MIFLKYSLTRYCLVLPLLFCLQTSKAQSRVDQLLTHLRNSKREYVMVAAHRGDWFWAPENSLQGFRNCIDMGVDIIELDVRMSKDDVPVVIHDITLERTTTGKGKVAEWTVDSLKTLYLKDATGVVTQERIPTLEEVCLLTKGKILIYLDKSADKIARVLPVLQKTRTLQQAMFVLDFSYEKAKAQFGTLLDSVLFVPVVADGMQDIEGYIHEHLTKAKPKAFQFRMRTYEGAAYPQLKKILTANSSAFVAATWSDHTIGHDDQVSRTKPDHGWGWLIENGFRILETNRPQQLLEYLRSKKLHD